ncbi:MAG: HepT-like ribonuclease domain-containing protein [Nitrospinales bacterium]
MHEYFGVDLQIIWQILKKDIPDFKISLKNIRAQLDD